MKTKNVTRYLVNSYRAIFKKCLTIHNFGYMALVVMLVTSGINGAFIVTADIAVAQTSGNNFNDSKEVFMEHKVLFEVLFTVEIHQNSSLVLGPQNDWQMPYTTDGTNLVIYITRKTQPSPHSPNPIPTGGRSEEVLWLEVPKKNLEIDENEITITEWSKLALLTTSSEILYFSSNGSGVLKIRKEGRSFHGTARFHFTDPSHRYNSGVAPDEYVDWTF